MVSFNIKYAIYIVEPEAIKASMGRGVLLSRRQEQKNKEPTTLVHCE